MRKEKNDYESYMQLCFKLVLKTASTHHHDTFSYSYTKHNKLKTKSQILHAYIYFLELAGALHIMLAEKRKLWDVLFAYIYFLVLVGACHNVGWCQVREGRAIVHGKFLQGFCHVALMGILVQVENGDKQFWNEKIHAANGKAQHALKVSWFYFSFKFWGGWLGGGGGIFSFFICSQHVPNGSHQVPNMWAKCGSTPSFHRIFYFGELW